jgi:hypothetical protein
MSKRSCVLLVPMVAASLAAAPTLADEVPADHIGIIRRAFNETMNDKAFLAEMEKQQLPVSPLTGEDAEQIVHKMMAAPPAVIAKAKEIFE